MSEKLDDLGRLHQMLGADLIDQDEYERLKAEVLEAGGVPAGDKPRVEVQPSDTPYWLSLIMGVLSIFAGIGIGLLAWATIGVSIWALTRLHIRKRRWMAWFGLVSGLLFSIANAYLYGHIGT